MNMKDAFRFQNKLKNLMCEATSILQDRRNIVKVKTTHLRSKVMSEALDAVVEETAPSEYAGHANEVAAFIMLLMEERENLSKALEYGEKLDRAREDEEADKPDYDAKLEALLPVVRGELPVHIHAHRADDIATGIRIAKEFGLKCVIVHGTEGHLLEREGVPVVTGPILGDRSKPELANLTIESPAVLTLQGVKTAICTDHPEVPIQYLPLCAALAVKGGMNPEAALAAITINAAEIAGIDHRVGSLAPGKDADIVVTSGHPINLLSRVLTVIINGRRLS